MIWIWGPKTLPMIFIDTERGAGIWRDWEDEIKIA